MPDFPIIDAHLHLWDPQELRLSWLDGNEILNRRYDLSSFVQQTEGITLAGMVYVEVGAETAYTLVEAQQVAQLARRSPQVLGIVAQAPVEYGTRVRSYLNTLRSFGPAIKGVRRMIQGEDDPGFCLQADFVRGVQLLAEYQFSFDLCLNYRQLASVIELVRQCPETSFMVDHIAKPDIKQHMLDPWREQMSRLAEFPNVYCKVSGMTTEADHQHWQIEDLAPYVGHVFAAFGEDRVVYGGDWPVMLLASTYRRWVETLEILTKHLSSTARRKFWCDNARRFYHL